MSTGMYYVYVGDRLVERCLSRSELDTSVEFWRPHGKVSITTEKKSWLYWKLWRAVQWLRDLAA